MTTTTNNNAVAINEAIRTKFRNVVAELSNVMLERDDEIELTVGAMLAGEHVAFVGVPGTGKSFMLNAVNARCEDSDKTFTTLISKTTTPDEVVGPFKPNELINGKFLRASDRKLPTADFAFLDEVFKGSSATLNAFLTIMNERLFDNGSERVNVPLRMLTAASNEWPGEHNGDGAELGALFDRFLFRKTIRPVAERGNLRKLIDPRHKFDVMAGGTTFSLADLDAAQADVAKIRENMTDDVLDRVMLIFDELAAVGINVTDANRRISKATDALAAFAYLRGRDAVSFDDLDVLAHCLWISPENADKTEEIVLKNCNPIRASINALLGEAESIVRTTATDADVATLAEAMQKLKFIIEGDSNNPAKSYLKQFDPNNADVAKAIEAVGKIREAFAAKVI